MSQKKKEFIFTSEAIRLCEEEGFNITGGRKTLSTWHKQFKLGHKTPTGRLRFDKEKLLSFIRGEFNDTAKSQKKEK